MFGWWHGVVAWSALLLAPVAASGQAMSAPPGGEVVASPTGKPSAPAMHDLRMAREAGLVVVRAEIDRLLAELDEAEPNAPDRGRRAALAVGLAGLLGEARLDPTDHHRVARALERGLQRPGPAPRDDLARVAADELQVLLALLDDADDGPLDHALLAALAADRVAQLAALRTAHGGWSRPGAPADAETTAHVVTALSAASAAGLSVPAGLLEGAVAGLRRARLGPELVTPTLWPLQARGDDQRLSPAASLARVQSVHRALRSAGEPLPPEDVLEGLDAFYRHHRFLDLALWRKDGRPGLHGLRAEQYLAAHLDAARLLPGLSRAERARYVGRLAVDVLATRRADGSFMDGAHGGHGRLVGTARAVLTLQALLDA